MPIMTETEEEREEEANDAQRWSAINSIINSISQSTVDNSGEVPKCTANPDFDIPESAICLGTGSDCCDLTEALVSENYLSKIPEDPSGGSAEDTGYVIVTNASQAICVSAPISSSETEIKVCR